MLLGTENIFLGDSTPLEPCWGLKLPSSLPALCTLARLAFLSIMFTSGIMSVYITINCMHFIAIVCTIQIKNLVNTMECGINLPCSYVSTLSARVSLCPSQCTSL